MAEPIPAPSLEIRCPACRAKQGVTGRSLIATEFYHPGREVIVSPMVATESNFRPIGRKLLDQYG